MPFDRRLCVHSFILSIFLESLPYLFLKNNLCSSSKQVGTSTVSKRPPNTDQNNIVQQKFVSFDVIIEDKNEFAPKFSRSEITFEINENTPVNFTIPLEAAIDRDSRQNEIIYSLEFFDSMVNKNSRIRLDTSKSLSDVNIQQLKLVLLEPFDYENEKELSFKIIARDGGGGHNNAALDNSLIGSQLVTLKIVDLNDNLPVFDRSEYEYRLDEVSGFVKVDGGIL